MISGSRLAAHELISTDDVFVSYSSHDTFRGSGTNYARLSLRGYRTEYVKIIVRSTAEDENTDVKLDPRRSHDSRPQPRAARRVTFPFSIGYFETVEPATGG